MGTVMEFNDGIDRKVLVLDAVYRSPEALQFGANGIITSLINYVTDASYLNPNDKVYTATSVTEAESVTDDWINQNVIKDDNTAKQNCDVWMTYNNQKDSSKILGVPAVAYCRSIQVNGVPCDLPNIQTLARIYCEANALDAMDPTVEENKNRALGTQNPQGAWYISDSCSNFSFSSTNYTKDRCWNVFCTGLVGTGGKYSLMAVLPVLEL